MLLLKFSSAASLSIVGTFYPLLTGQQTYARRTRIEALLVLFSNFSGKFLPFIEIVVNLFLLSQVISAIGEARTEHRTLKAVNGYKTKNPFLCVLCAFV
jgi:hypothetical protein